MKVSRITILNLIVLVCFAIVGIAIAGAVMLHERADYSPPTPMAAKVVVQMFNGTIEGLDAAGLKVIIQTEMGLESLPVKTASVMQGLNQGDQVTAALDEQGYVMSIIKQNPKSPDSNAPKLKG